MHDELNESGQNAEFSHKFEITWKIEQAAEIGLS